MTLINWSLILAERSVSKFHICLRSLASQRNIHFSDNISAAEIISGYTNRLKGQIYLISLFTILVNADMPEDLNTFVNTHNTS